MQRPPTTVVTGAIAVAMTAAIFATLEWRAASAPIPAGFWYDDFPFTLPSDATARLGGPLTAEEVARIKHVSRQELERALSGLRIVVTDERDAFWRMRVVREIKRVGGVARGLRVPIAGESLGLGPLGGAGTVSFLIAAIGAVAYAPPDAPRTVIVEGIGRGVGRAAAHEFSHVIVNATHSSDINSYEYRSSDRASQYYGELHWSTAWPTLEARFGK